MVESAPQDRKRLPPSMANPTLPAMKAKKPICGSKPPSRAVAICSGIAIAAKVRPAIRSPGRSAGRHDASERNSGQDFSLCAIVSPETSPAGRLQHLGIAQASSQRVGRLQLMVYQFVPELAFGLDAEVAVHAFGFSRLLPEPTGALAYRLFVQLG